MKVAKEETFGPVAPLFRFESEDDVLAMANDSEYGLAAYFYSRDLARVWRVAEGLESGMVGINTGLISTEVAPFGGVQTVGTGAGGLQIRHRGLPRAEIPLHGRDRLTLRPLMGRAQVSSRLDRFDPIGIGKICFKRLRSELGRETI